MEDIISAEIVTATWQRMSQQSASEVLQLMEVMKEEQPVVLAYLLAVDDSLFNRHEQEIIFYIGTVVWQMMKQSRRRLHKVTRRKLEQAEQANFDYLEMLSSDTDADFYSATLTMLENYPEREVLRYISEALMEEENYEPDDPPIRDEYRGMAFVHLKTVLDAFINSLA